MWRLIAVLTIVGAVVVAQISASAFAAPVAGVQVAVNSATSLIYVAGPSAPGWVSVIDGTTSRLLTTIPTPDYPGDLTVNENTNRIYVTDIDGVSVIDGMTFKVIDTIGVRGVGIATNPVTNRIFLTRLDNTVAVIDGVAHSVIASVPVGPGPTAIGVNSLSNRIYVGNKLDHTISVIDGATNTVVATIPTGGGTGIAVNEATDRIYSVWTPGVAVIDGASGIVLAQIPIGQQPRESAVDPQTNRLYVSKSFGARLAVIDTGTNTVISNIWAGDGPYGVAVNPVTKRIYAANTRVSTVSILLENELLDNSSFDGGVDVGGVPNRWRGQNLGPDDEVVGNPDIYDGRQSFRIEGTPGVAKELKQTVAVSGSAGAVLNLEAWSKASGVSSSGGDYRVKVSVQFSDGTSDAFAVGFQKGTHDWRRQNESYTAPKDFERVVISVILENQTGTVWFDALHLWRD